MLAIRKNEDGYVYAYVDYRIVNQDGTDNKEGIYCYVWNIWVHPKYRRKDVLKEWLDVERIKFPLVKWLYFKRSKYGGRIRMFDIGRLHEKV